MNTSVKFALDWSAIRRRLDETRQSAEAGWQLSREEKKRVLRARAQALAKELPSPKSPGESLQFVKFQVAHEYYGLELSYVREVYPLKDLTPLPGTPAYLLGVTNVRGQVLLIIDLKKLFGLPDQGLTEFNKIVIVEAPGVELGILADSVYGLESVPLNEIQPPLPTLKNVREEFLRGVTAQGWVLLDAQRLVAVRQRSW